MKIERDGSGNPVRIEMSRPDDWHLHLRDGEMLEAVVSHSARRFGRAIIMPNLVPPVTTTEMALAYRERILAALPDGSSFQPLMTLYLTDNTTLEEIWNAHASGHVVACKLYPAGATTNSDFGVTSIQNIYPVLEALQMLGMVLCVHGEVTDGDVSVLDRERFFIDRVLERIVRDFPALPIVLEHLTTRQAVEFVLWAPNTVAATITPQHLLFDLNDLIGGMLQPHLFCKPVLKEPWHREALIQAATSGNPKFFLGTDSAPHRRHDKESPCGCAGCFSAPAALELYAEVFERLGALPSLEGFASHFGSDFYGLERNTGTITLVREPWTVPENIPVGDGSEIVPLWAGQTLNWRLVD